MGEFEILTKVTVFLKPGSGIWVRMRIMRGDGQNQGGNLGIAVELA